ncbi:hypothetical protein [Segnochrobactrum spirostomi]|nr:hypothetical protein [Segnochrobactrum spirostomi]
MATRRPPHSLLAAVIASALLLGLVAATGVAVIEALHIERTSR